MQFRICFSFHKRVVMWIINCLWWLKSFFLYKEIWIGEKVSFIYNVKIIVIKFVMRAYNTVQCHFTGLAQNWITPKPDSNFFCTILYHYAKTLKIISILNSWTQICWCYLQHADMHAYPTYAHAYGNAPTHLYSSQFLAYANTYISPLQTYTYFYS